jgi:predicted O-methyltransferase YrrM
VNCLYVFTLGYFFSRNRKIISNICELFSYHQRITEKIRPEVRTIIPKVKMSAIIKDDLRIELREPTWRDGNISLLELVVIINMIRQRSPRAIFEIGTFDGRTTLNLACNSPDDSKVYTLDLPPAGKNLLSGGFPISGNSGNLVNKHMIGSRFHETGCDKKITQLYGDSASFDFSPYENAMDFVFIDGSHAYEYVISDSEKALRLLKNGRGIILWHDYSWVWDGVAKAVNELYSRRPEFREMKNIEGTSLVYLRRASGGPAAHA